MCTFPGTLGEVCARRGCPASGGCWPAAHRQSYAYEDSWPCAFEDCRADAVADAKFRGWGLVLGDRVLV
jgi:hypothetical protein